MFSSRPSLRVRETFLSRRLSNRNDSSFVASVIFLKCDECHSVLLWSKLWTPGYKKVTSVAVDKILNVQWMSYIRPLKVKNKKTSTVRNNQIFGSRFNYVPNIWYLAQGPDSVLLYWCYGILNQAVIFSFLSYLSSAYLRFSGCENVRWVIEWNNECPLVNWNILAMLMLVSNVFSIHLLDRHCKSSYI